MSGFLYVRYGGIYHKVQLNHQDKKLLFRDVNRFYEKMIINIITNFNYNGCLNNKPNFDFIKDCLEKLLIQIQIL